MSFPLGSIRSVEPGLFPIYPTPIGLDLSFQLRSVAITRNRCGPQLNPWDGGAILQNEGASGHPCATFWADESLVLVFHHVMLSRRMGHESSSFWTLFHVVGVLFPFLACLLSVCATLRGVTFGNHPVLGCLRVGMGIRAVRLRDAFGL